MTQFSCTYGDGRDEAIVAFLYDESEASPTAASDFDAHLRTCAQCQSDVAALRGVRAQLARWSPPEPDEPVFHEAWEGRVLAMQRAMGFTRLWTIDGGRASMEVLPPVTYLASSYYERWLRGQGIFDAPVVAGGGGERGQGGVERHVMEVGRRFVAGRGFGHYVFSRLSDDCE
jgi:anti-sigma factor RsiW